MQEALKLIIAASPAAGADAMQCLRAIDVGSPMVQSRYNRVVELAFSDPMAEFTADGRKLIASYVEATGADNGVGPRSLEIRCRVSNAEFDAVNGMVRSGGYQSRSELMRSRLGLGL